RRSRARRPRRRTSRAVCRAWSSSSRRASRGRPPSSPRSTASSATAAAARARTTPSISEIDGVVRHGGIVKGQRKIIIVPEEGGEPREYSLPRGVHVNVQEGDRKGV